VAANKKQQQSVTILENGKKQIFISSNLVYSFYEK